jgi:hypothetical protein
MAPALAWLTALMVVPCALVLALAFFRRGIYGGIEYTFTLENFGQVLDPLYAGIFLNSARIAGTATLIAVIIGYAAAYAISAAQRPLIRPLRGHLLPAGEKRKVPALAISSPLWERSDCPELAFAIRLAIRVRGQLPRHHFDAVEMIGRGVA